MTAYKPGDAVEVRRRRHDGGSLGWWPGKYFAHNPHEADGYTHQVELDSAAFGYLPKSFEPRDIRPRRTPKAKPGACSCHWPCAWCGHARSEHGGRCSVCTCDAYRCRDHSRLTNSTSCGESCLLSYGHKGPCSFSSDPKPKPAKRKARKRKGADPERLSWVRSLPCACCGFRATISGGHVDAHHPRGHAFGTGTGVKSSDALAFPLCPDCHRDLHNHRGPFAAFSKADRAEWQAAQSEVYRVLWRVESRRRAGEG